MSVFRVIGLASGAALDGIKAALLETDGADRVSFGDSLFLPFERAHKVFIRRAMKAALEGRDSADDIDKARGAITRAYAQAATALLEQAGLAPSDVDFIGFDGPTILHRPPQNPGEIGRLWQIGDAAALAARTEIDVVADLRQGDIEGGGQGAPLSPIFYAALARGLGRSHRVAVLDIGAAANVTYAPPHEQEGGVIAFDCGPGHDLMNAWFAACGREVGGDDRDIFTGGLLTDIGAVDEELVRMMALSPFLRQAAPKFLKPHDFKLDALKGLSLEDGAATLIALIAACVERSVKIMPQEPQEWVVLGAGAFETSFVEALRRHLSAPVLTAKEAGWLSDKAGTGKGMGKGTGTGALAAQAAAYLGVRSVKGLPLSFPKTTKVARPMPGGTLYKAPRE